MWGNQIERIRKIDPLTGQIASRAKAKSPARRSTRNPTTSCPPPKRPRHRWHLRRAGMVEMRTKPPGKDRRSAAHRATHPLRHRNDADHRLLPRHRKLLAPPFRPVAGRSAADPARLRTAGLPASRRRIAPDHPAAARHVPRRPVEKTNPRRITDSVCPRPSTIVRSPSRNSNIG